MKTYSGSLVIVLSLLITFGCGGKKGGTEETQTGDISSVPDTGYTGIKQYYSHQLLVRETTFKNGIREGLTKTYYQEGPLRQSFWYEDGLREDTAKWYYPQGQVFRETPYKRDTIEGIQIQYYRNGDVKAKLEYKKGKRTLFFEEYTQRGQLVDDYPDLVITTQDNYNSRGTYRITLGLSDESTRVRYYRGDLYNGTFDTARCTTIDVRDGIGTLDMKKTGTPTSTSVGVFAEILTSFGNNVLVHKQIDLPYNDLN